MRVLGIIVIATLLATSARGADRKAPAAVSVRVKTALPGAQVSLDGQPVGETPLTLDPLPDGKYTLQFSLAGHEDHEEILDIRGGKPASLFVVLKAHPVELPAFPVRYAVLHLHVNDACQGELTVSRDQLEFAAASGPDRFTISIPSARMIIRRHAAAYLHSMSYVGLVEVGSSAQPVVAPMRVEAPDRAYTFLVLNSEGTVLDGVGTRELYEIVYRLWDEAQPGTKK
jgi:hypothetical protein